MLVLLTVGPANAEPWLCPDCPDEAVEREPGAKELICPGCGTTYNLVDLAPPVAYINSRTRDTEIAWVVESDDCDIFRLDGLQAFDGNGGIVWVPWSLVDWYIPRMRILKLTNGREMRTDYPKGKDNCPSPPRFLFEVADSVSIPGQPPAVRNFQQDETMAELFIVAMSPEGRDSARVRFIHEVETGKQPRLPRTQPKLYRASRIQIPPAVLANGFEGETIIEVRVSDRQALLAERLVSGSGHPELDAVALQAVKRSAFFPGGEMGVPVPAWLRLRAVFQGDSARLETVEIPDGFWRR